MRAELAEVAELEEEDLAAVVSVEAGPAGGTRDTHGWEFACKLSNRARPRGPLQVIGAVAEVGVAELWVAEFGVAELMVVEFGGAELMVAEFDAVNPCCELFAAGCRVCVRRVYATSTLWDEAELWVAEFGVDELMVIEFGGAELMVAEFEVATHVAGKDLKDVETRLSGIEGGRSLRPAR